MAPFFFSSANTSKFTEELPAPKRISTPAGLRLSTILENGDNQAKSPTRAKRLSLNRPPVLVEDPTEEASTPSQGYSYSVVSEKSAHAVSSPARLHNLRNNVTRRGGWKRLVVFVAVGVLALTALIIGLAIGLSYQHKLENSSSESTSSPQSGGPNPPAATNGAASKNFPVGSWSVVTFLDTVYTNCTSDPATWTCFPYTIYANNPVQAEATFNWIISTGSNPSTYVISSTNNPFAIEFQNVSMTIKDAGTSSEHYWFQITMDKQVSPSQAITADNSAATCFFNRTTFTGYLYTKIASAYPPGGQSTGGTYPQWPFAARAEQTMSGGEGVPNCYETNNGNLGQRIPVNATAFGDLCDCLYMNYLAPIPNT